MVRNHLVLPIAHHPVSLGLLGQVILILDVHPSVVLEIAHREFVHFLSEQFLAVLCIQGLVNAHFLFVLRLLAEDKLLHAILGHLVVHICCWFDLQITSEWCQITKPHVFLAVGLARVRWLFQIRMNLYDAARVLLLKH